MVVVSPVRHESHVALDELFIRAQQNAPQIVLVAVSSNADGAVVAVSCDPPRQSRIFKRLLSRDSVISGYEFASISDWLADGHQLWVHCDNPLSAAIFLQSLNDEVRSSVWITFVGLPTASLEIVDVPVSQCCYWADLGTLPMGFERLVADLADARWRGIVLPSGQWSAGHVAMVHKFGLLAIARNAVRRHVVDEALYAGVDVVIGEDPTMLAAAVEHALR